MLVSDRNKLPNQSQPVEVSEAQAIFDSIRRIVQALRHFSKCSEKELGVSSAQLFVLQKISESQSPLSINDLAEATLTHQSSVSVVVSKLVHRKLVERVQSKVDSRAVELKLSKQGLALLEKTPPSIQERLVDAIVRMDNEGRQSLVQGLHTLIQNAGLEKEEASLFFEDREAKKYEN